MKFNIASLALIAASASIMLPAYADDAARQQAKQMVSLQDGGTLYIFADEKMAKADKYGRPESLSKGEVMQATDGQALTATSNEVARLRYLQRKGHSN